MTTPFRRAVSLLCLLVAAGCGPTTPTKRTYKIGIVQWAAYTPLPVAEREGLWQRFGLDVKVQPYFDNRVLNDDLNTGKIDLACDMLGSWVDLFLTNTPLTILGETDWSHGGDKIVVRNENLKMENGAWVVDPAKLTALRGRNVGLYLKLLSVQYFAGTFLQEHGLKLSDFTVVEDSPDKVVTGVNAGTFPFGASYDPSTLAVDAAQARIVKTSKDYAGVIPEGFVARSDRLNAIPRADLVKIFQGWAQGVEWAAQAIAEYDAGNKEGRWRTYARNQNEYTYGCTQDTASNCQAATFDDATLRGMLANVRVHRVGDKDMNGLPATSVIDRNKSMGGLHEYLTNLNTFDKANNLHTKAFTPTEVWDNSAMMEALKL